MQTVGCNFTTVMGLYQLISTATFSSLFFLAMLVLAKKANSLNGYKFLSLFFIFLSFVFADAAFNNTGVYTDYPVLALLFQPVLYAVAPAFYLAVIYLTAVNKKIAAVLLLHFIPYFIFLCLYILILFITGTEKPSVFDNSPDSSTKSVDVFFSLFLFAQIFIYLYLSVRQLKRHERALPLFVSNIADNDYRWVYKIIAGLIILSVIWLLETIFNNKQLSFYFSFIYLAGVYYIGIQAIRQKDVFPFSKEQNESIGELIEEHNIFNTQKIDYSPNTEETVLTDKKPDTDPEPTNTIPDRRKVLSAEKTDYYKELLMKLMEHEKPYLNSDITLPKLGTMLLLNTYQTSYLINTCFNENFYTFINRYRVNECKRMLENNQYNHLNILGIGYEAGFNSKTAFNTTFKKLTGLSPKEYKIQTDKSSSPPSNIL
jgi:AraC-like DNA-binding protein